QKPAGPPPGSSGVHPNSSAPANEDAYFRQVHEEFVALKKKLGEPVDGLTFDRFEVTLKKNRDALVARYGCKSVKFNVYEKDGKASLKAIPVKS
ncbi:MAG: cell division protein FtsK, partial [Deltaproteobacteria bacterium]|nr:cell division protein FtsK [Deltaproteobacteria bacterium]